MSDRTNFEDASPLLDNHQPQVVTQPQASIPAGFWIRFVATVIDGVIVMTIQFPVKLIGDTLGRTDTMVWNVYMTAFGFLMTFVYSGYFLTSRAATPGKMLMSLKVIRTDGAVLDFRTVFFREILGKAISGFTLGIGYFIAGFRKDKKALHDIIADTQVILVNK